MVRPSEVGVGVGVTTGAGFTVALGIIGTTMRDRSGRGVRYPSSLPSPPSFSPPSFSLPSFSPPLNGARVTTGAGAIVFVGAGVVLAIGAGVTTCVPIAFPAFEIAEVSDCFHARDIADAPETP